MTITKRILWATRLAIIGGGFTMFSFIGTGAPWRRIPSQFTVKEPIHRFGQVTPREKKEELPNILFVKPHKTGSSSMATLIRLIAARNGGLPGEYMYPLNYTINFFGREELQPLEKGTLHIWTDHEYLRRLLQVAVPQVVERSFKLTLVRDPIDRCLSAFYYYTFTKTGVDLGTLSEHQLTELKLGYEYCGHTKHQSSQMCEVAPQGRDSSVLETLAFYNLVGVMDRYTETLAVMKMMLGLCFGDMLFFDDKTSGVNHKYSRPLRMEEPPEVLQHMQALVEGKDSELYAAANRKLSKVIRSLEPEFSAVHSKLVHSLATSRAACDPWRGREGRGGRKKREPRVRDGFGCFKTGTCRLSCLNKYADNHGLWDE